MTTHHFAALIEEFCKLTGFKDPLSIVHGAPIEVDGIVFSLTYSEKINPDLLFIYCDFGDPPAGRDSETYKAVLAKNLFLYTGNGPVYTISPDTGRIVLAQHQRLDSITPGELAEKLTMLAAQSQAWRKDPCFSEEARHQTKQTSKTTSAAFTLLHR